MKKFSCSFVILLLFATITASNAQVILLDQKQSDYRIILPAKPEKDEIKAATEFQKYFEKISGVILPVYDDDQEPTAHEIIIGKSIRLISHKVKSSFKAGEQDGFLLLTKDEKLFITGGSPAGTLNGVYTFLEEYLGCRLYSPEYNDVPKLNSISLPAIKDRQVPYFSYRELLFPGRYDTNYLAWHKLHSHHDGSWGMWVHTFDDLVAPETYFKDHPEYFTEINGARSDKGQLCLSNPEVFEVLVENLGKKMAGRPDARYWSVSQNDNYLACQCNECRKISEEYGGESGLMIWFVNRV
ncbi:MAG: DUF4838 domain-containing protein, partial [Bacteroidales bacterium]|nr:DUF4838 domain-containing protein [Bacteroidales bacterium]